jgi:Rps23 Pro-64 3,4-dihydroxylase Tpa1-like proline 4-hydroxylase
MIDFAPTTMTASTTKTSPFLRAWFTMRLLLLALLMPSTTTRLVCSLETPKPILRVTSSLSKRAHSAARHTKSSVAFASSSAKPSTQQSDVTTITSTTSSSQSTSSSSLSLSATSSIAKNEQLARQRPVLLTNSQLAQLFGDDVNSSNNNNTNGFVILPNFISSQFQRDLRLDVLSLRDSGRFSQAQVGSVGSTTTTTTTEKPVLGGAARSQQPQIRVAESCEWLQEPAPAPAVRQALYRLLNDVRVELMEYQNSKYNGSNNDNDDEVHNNNNHGAEERERSNKHSTTTATTTATTAATTTTTTTTTMELIMDELSYLYYPNGGFFRRHVDSVPGTISESRTVSLLLYLNPDWTEHQAGQLRIHRYVKNHTIRHKVQPHTITSQSCDRLTVSS